MMTTETVRTNIKPVTEEQLALMEDTGQCKLVEGRNVLPKKRSVYVVYHTLTNVRELTEHDTLTGDKVLPGFSLPVARLFDE
jgi:hypothetical protein